MGAIVSKVKIQGNASGTGVLTLEAPNTNTDRTITLPDEDITLGGGVDGIVSTANATAITIDSSERVGIGHPTPTYPLHVLADTAGQTVAKFESDQAGAVTVALDGGADRDVFLEFQEAGTKRWDFWMNGSSGTNPLKIRSDDGTTRLELMQDGTSKFYGSGGLVEQFLHSSSMTMGVDAVYSVAGGPLNTGALISIGSTYRSNNTISYVHGLFMGSYAKDTTVMLADTHSTFANNDQIYKVCCYSNNMSANLYIKNRLSITNTISISVQRYQGL